MTTNFPNDENGDVLRMMASNGDDLDQPREMDFSVIFPTEDSALLFAVDLLREGLKVSFAPYEGNQDLPWQVQSHPFMLPTHENISGFEGMLGERALRFGGNNDGWGCESQD